jgi:two-component system sensor histidine kinase PilS (NtrC family)
MLVLSQCYSVAMTHDDHITTDTQPLAITGQRNRLFMIYNGYRIVLALVLLSLEIFQSTPLTLGSASAPSQSVELFNLGLLLILVSGLIVFFNRVDEKPESDTRFLMIFLIDVVAITLISHSSGGLISGFSALFVVTVASAAMVLNTQILATLIAAISVISVLIDASALVSRSSANLEILLPAAILGSLLFIISWLIQILSLRLSKAAAAVDNMGDQVAALRALSDQIVSNLQTGILRIDAAGQIRPINPAARRLLEMDHGESRGLYEVSRDLAGQYLQWHSQSAYRPEPFRMRRDAPALIATFSALDSGGERETLAFVDDYTPVTQFAQSLKLNSLGQLTASIAHEVRNPLASISHASQLLQESKSLSSADQELCQILISNSNRVNNIIEDVLHISRREPPALQTFAFSDWLTSFMEEYAASHLGADFSVNSALTDDPVAVRFDPLHLKRVLTNLLDNAIRHGGPSANGQHGRIDIIPDRARSRCHVDIIDFGLGVPEQNESRLFEPFFTTSKEGTGLGLYLCKELCEINGSELIYCRTARDESCFRLSVCTEEGRS